MQTTHFCSIWETHIKHVVKHVKQSSLIVKSKRKDLERTRQVARPVLPYPPLLFELSFILSLRSVLFQAHSDKHIHSLALFYALLLFFVQPAGFCFIAIQLPDGPPLIRAPLHSSPPKHTHTHTPAVSISHTLHSAAAMLMNLRNREMGKWQGIIRMTLCLITNWGGRAEKYH